MSAETPQPVGSAGPARRGRSARPSRPARSGIRRITGSFWFNLLAAFVVLALVQAFLVKVYYVPSGSMQQTLSIGDRLLVDRVSLDFSDPKDGDIVVFTASDLWGETPEQPSNPLLYAVRWLGGIVGVGPNLDHTLVKRVIAGPGQTVSCCDAEGHLLVDGLAVDEPYVYADYPFAPGSFDCGSTPVSMRCFGELTVPAGQYFVLGDHRSNSNDSIFACRGRDPTSACLKMVGRGDIVGRVAAIVFPPSDWRGF
ncbi:signal peptidase I [Subtercola boreus]|uniref:Signal peptidase I n=1 Tax=Subtercola boreus TaxID=120213 RepID=A0A3E0W4P5_9MICO|nr:signal peptidase I [Subtercola boreus]RFA16458.1 signal peptidase I [Subtercola boreus]